MKFLIVDDDPINLRILSRALSPYGVVDTAVSGEEAVARFTQRCSEDDPYQAVLLDIMMPGMDGRQVLQVIRNTEPAGLDDQLPSVKVIMMTSLEDSESICSAYTEGCDAYIVKPVTQKVLEERLEELGLLVESATKESDSP